MIVFCLQVMDIVLSTCSLQDCKTVECNFYTYFLNIEVYLTFFINCISRYIDTLCSLASCICECYRSGHFIVLGLCKMLQICVVKIVSLYYCNNVILLFSALNHNLVATLKCDHNCILHTVSYQKFILSLRPDTLVTSACCQIIY